MRSRWCAEGGGVEEVEIYPEVMRFQASNKSVRQRKWL